MVALGAPGCSHDGEGGVHHDARDPDGEEHRDSGDDAGRILARARSAVNDSLRPDQDRERDPLRRPAELLGFFGIDEGMRVADLQATHGYYTEILSTVVGPGGRVYAQNNDFVVARFGERLGHRLQKLREAGRDNVERMDAEMDEMELPRDLDVVLLVRFYHDLFWQPRPDGTLTDRAEFLRRVYGSLKPGGVFGVVDHHAQAGSGARAALDSENGLHRIDVELVKQEVLAVGFLLQDESTLLRHPEDTRDWNIFIENRTRRDTTDRFVLRFVKPWVDEIEWEAELAGYRTEKDERFRTSSTSPMAGTQYLKSEPAERVWLTREERSFGLAYDEPPEASLFVARSDGAWHWSAGEDGVGCRVDKDAVPEGAALERQAEFAVGGLSLGFYPSEDRVTFIVFDPERPNLKAFEHLLYFPPAREFAVDARIERLADPDEVEMLTSRNLVKKFHRYAKIHFELEGRALELTAFKSKLTGAGSKGLFIPFRDATSGHETYGAGRFLSIDEPVGDRFLLDFNRSFNPLCSYSPAYNCTVPPRENHLAVPILAGEKTYPH
jgi:predicted methyltransferase/uncharacterized protein (DUF1684 family)